MAVFNQDGSFFLCGFLFYLIAFNCYDLLFTVARDFQSQIWSIDILNAHISRVSNERSNQRDCENIYGIL